MSSRWRCFPAAIADDGGDVDKETQSDSEGGRVTSFMRTTYGPLINTHTQTHKHTYIYIYIDNGIFTTLSIYIYMCDTLIKTVVSRGETSGSERLLGLMIKNNNNKNNKKWKIFSLSYRDGASGATARLAEPVPRHDMPAVGGATGGRGGRLVRRGRTGGLGLWILGHPVCLILL